jgi:hypothetical protein
MRRTSSGVNAGRSTPAATSVATTHIPVRSPDVVFVHKDRSALVNKDINCTVHNGMSTPTAIMECPCRDNDNEM